MSKDPLEYPKLRWPIDLRVEDVGGSQAIILICPIGIASQPLVLVPAVGPLLSKFEGQLSIDQIVAQFAQYGIQRAVVEQLVSLLDGHLFLESPRFFEAEQRAKKDFRESNFRPAALAGLSYSSNSAVLVQEIDGYLSHASDLRNAISLPQIKGPMIGIMSPHIDYHRGGVCYGITWAQMQREIHDLYVVIGTAHQYSRALFHLSRKTFVTPLGSIPCDLEICAKVAKSYGEERAFDEEILHRREHSLELQLPFLQRVLSLSAAGRTNHVSMLPILVGSFYGFLRDGKAPCESDEYNALVQSLSESLAEQAARGRRTCIIAGVDMAHVGRAFGDEGSLTPEFMDEIKARDQSYLAAIKARDKQALFAHIAEDGDSRRICGFPSMYTMLDVYERAGLSYEVEVFDYRQAVDYQRDCAVTFAGAGFYLTSTGAPA